MPTETVARCFAMLVVQCSQNATRFFPAACTGTRAVSVV